MANKADEKGWKKALEQQKEEVEEITESFKEFFQNNQELTADELKNFIKSQAEQAESGKVKADLMKRLSAVENIKGADQLTGEDLKQEINKLPEKFHDDMEIMTASITKGNELLSSGFSQMTGVLRESFGPIFDLFDQGGSILGGIYNTIMGVFAFVKVVPAVLRSMGGYFKRKEKREMREGGEGPSLIEQILKGIGILGIGIVGAFAMFTENVTKSFMSAFSTIGKIIRTTFISPITRFLSKFKIGQRIIDVFSRISARIKGIGSIGGRILAKLGEGSKSINPIIRGAAKGSRFLVRFGGFLGKIFLPLIMAYEAVKGLFDPGSIRDKILSASAGMLGAFLKLPEMIGNALLALFGVEFRFDFGKEEIIAAVNRITEGAEKPIHAMLDFFTKTIPEYFKKFTDGIKDLIPSGEEIKSGLAEALQFNPVLILANKIGDLLPGIKNGFLNLIPSGDDIKSGLKEVVEFDLMGGLADKIKNLGDGVKGWFEDKLSFLPGIGRENQKERSAKIPSDVDVGFKTGGIVKEGGYAKVHSAEVIVPQDLSRKLLKIIDNQDTTSISKYENEKIKLYKQIRDYLGNMIEIYREQNNIMQGQQREQDREANRNTMTNVITEPPDEIESMSLLLFNKSWGMG